MGGPGVILSRQTLLRAAPYFSYCTRHLLSPHEDVEIGRCISRFTNTKCTLALEVHANIIRNKRFGVQFAHLVAPPVSKQCKAMYKYFRPR
jgi:Chondroitin N-acetylgalactosaminyltransferase